jgi:hypothetical protein
MGKIRANGYTREFQGRVGPHVFVRRASGMMIAQIRPDRSHLVPSPAQEEAIRRFKRGVVWAKEVLEDPVKRVPFDVLAVERKESAFSFALAEFFRHPWVAEINLDAYHGQIGETIGVSAVDAVAVTGVTVVIRDSATNAILEQGAAARMTEDWAYTSTTTLPAGQSVKIEVTARNRDGKELTEEQAYP